MKQEESLVPLARVNDTYLYHDEIVNLVPSNASQEDSIQLVSSFINRWATQQLLMDRARINLTEDQLKDYERLVEQYKNDLYTEAYKQTVVSMQLDSVISEEEMELYYQTNKENFKLNDDILKFRYIHVGENYGNLNDIKAKLNQFDKTDKEELEMLSIQFKSYNFNDSIWIKRESLFQNIPVLQTAGNQVLKKSNFTQLQDSLGVYLVKIVDVLGRNDAAPLAFVTPTIEQIILNKRKLELIKNLEIDITKDAIKNKKFETFTQQ